MDLSKLIFPNLKSYKLTNLLSNFGIENENPHRAYSDAFGALKLFQIIISNDLEMKVIKSKIKTCKGRIVFFIIILKLITFELNL